MLSVRELIKELEKMPQDAKVLVHVKELRGFQELGGFQKVELIKTMDGKGLGEEFGEIVVVLDEKPVPKKKHCKNSVNTLYCQGFSP